MRFTPKSRKPRSALRRPPSGGAAVVRGRYRYSLTRWWEPARGTVASRVLWIMLNPSRADALLSDPTIGRVRAFSEAWGFTSFEVGNLFAYRTPSPAHLWKRRCDIVGPWNEDYLRAAVSNAHLIVVAWGAAADPRVEGRVEVIRSITRPHGRRVMCLGQNQGGGPKHPLYLAASTELREFAFA